AKRKQKKVGTYIVNELILDKLIKIEPHKIKGAYPQKLDFFHSNFQGSSHWISCGLFILKRLRFVPASFFRSTLNGAYHLEDSCIFFYTHILRASLQANNCSFSSAVMSPSASKAYSN